MPKKMEVIVTTGSRTYTTTHSRAQQAEAAARERQALEQSGELRRRELTKLAEQYRRQLLSLGYSPYGEIPDNEFCEQIRTLAGRIIPTQVEELERWVEQMPLLIETLKVEKEERQRQAKERRKAELEAEKEMRLQLRIKEARLNYQATLDEFKRGYMPLMDNELSDAINGVIRYGIITQEQGDRLKRNWVEGQKMDEVEERYGNFADRYYRLTKTELAAIQYRGANRDRRPRRDGDRYKDRRWNRWQIVY